MAAYGVTDDGFVIKRLDVILEQIHSKLTDGFGFDTRLQGTSYINTLVTTFGGQIATLWEVAQDSYYAKFPSTAEGKNLDNAVQFGGIYREPDTQSIYPLHCTGTDGTAVKAGVYVATDTNPQIQLYSQNAFTITRDDFNIAGITVAAVESSAVYTVNINGTAYAYTSSSDATAEEIIEGLAGVIADDDFTVTYEDELLTLTANTTASSNVLILSDNLTTDTVTTIANFVTDDYGYITIPNGLVTVFINNVSGFSAVTNLISPTYGRTEETDVELRQSYIAKSALRSSTMVESICAALLSNVDGVLTASGYENDTDEYDSYNRPPHSIEIVVDGGGESEIAEVILNYKAGGIQTYGSVTVGVATTYGDTVSISFNRPEYLYTWIKIVLHGSSDDVPSTYATLAIDAVADYGEDMSAGDSLLIQKLHETLYENVAGITYIDIYTAYSTDSSYTPDDDDYAISNIIVEQRQKILIESERITVELDEDS